MDIKSIELELEPLNESNNFLQSPFWARFKSLFGWHALTFAVRYDKKKTNFLVLYRVVANTFSIGYVPYPLFNDSNIALEDREIFFKEVSKKIKSFLPKISIFIRWDLDFFTTDDEFPKALKKPFKKAILPIQPSDTFILNLEQSEEQILENMHKKTRYNISLAEKKGVVIERAGVDAMAKWYDIYKETAKRDGIAIHSLDYYQKFFMVSGERAINPQARLYLATHDGDLLAGIITLFYGDTATYVYGASSNIKRNLMANYALQWRAIVDAKNANCIEYDFFGCPPKSDENHPMYGLFQFKSGFGGKLVHRLGAYDYSYNPILYSLYCVLENYRDNKKKENKKTHKK